MTLIRRAILALALIAGFSPAIAAPPPPVPAMPFAERRITYTLFLGPCNCYVGFPVYGDGVDYQNWIEVYIDGVLVPFNDPTRGWTVTSPTGPLGLIPRPIVDAQLNFPNPVTGTVQVVGARVPRRVSQFNDGRALTARDLNLAMTDIVATQREFWDKTNDITGRTLQSQPGVTLGRLPLPDTCQNAFLGFDAAGTKPLCRSSSGTGNVTLPVINGNLVAFDGTHGLLKDSGLSGGIVTYVTPQSLNFKCDGTPETGILQSAVNALPAVGGVIYIPPGSVCNDLSFVTLNKPNVTILGVGNKTFLLNPPSKIIYAGTAANYIDSRYDSLRIDGVGIYYSSSTWTGTLVYVSGTAGGNVSPLPTIRNSRLGPSTSRTGTATLVKAGNTVDLLVDQVFFHHGAPAIDMRPGPNVRTTIRGSWFSESDAIPIVGCGDSMLVEGNSLEPLANGQAGAFIGDGSLYCKSLAWRSNWHGDVSVAGGTWIDGYFKGFDYSANSMAGLGIIGGTGIVLRGPSTGVNMDANYFELLDTAVNVATAGTGLRMGQNPYSNVTTPVTNPSNVTAGDFTLASTGINGLSIVNSNVGIFGSATKCVTVTNNAKGLTTAISEATCTPAASSITGIISAAQGGFGIDASAASGIPIFASGIPTFTPTNGTGNPVRTGSPALTGTPTTPTASPGTNTTQIASTAYADAIAALKANLASPTFTGTPAAPTAAVDTNTTQIASTAWFMGQLASAAPLINGTAAVGTSTRPARGDHVHPTDTTRAPLVSPSFTTPSLGVATATSINGVTLDNTAWSTYTSTFSATTGTATVVAKQKTIGKTTFVTIDITFTSAVTGTFTVTLPNNPVNSGSLYGQVLSAGVAATANYNAASNVVSVFKYDGNQILANGSHTVISGVYESP